MKAPLHKIYQPYMVESAGGPSKDKLSAQVDKVREIATAYGRQVQVYGKRWKDLKPDFWTPLNVALNTILSEIDAKAK